MQEPDTLHNPIQLTRQIVQCLGQGESVALATVIVRSGSGPREAGATMLVRPDGSTLGTVGGGLLEGQATAIAREVLAGRLAACRSFSLAETRLAAGGMICGGDVELLADFLDAADPACRAVFAGMLERQEANRPCWLVRAVPAPDGKSGRTGLGLLDDEGLERGTLADPLPGTDLLIQSRRREETVVIGAGERRIVLQPAGLAATVFIFGAGHVGRELAPICSAIGYRTIVIDDRAEFATAERFPSAAGIVVPDSYEECFRRLSFAPSSAIVIVTHAHAHDKEVLSLALKTKAGYVGMISSRRKRELILAALREEGAAEADLERVHSPIGLAIGARTPAEIAVSIAAELIAVRAGKLR